MIFRRMQFRLDGSTVLEAQVRFWRSPDPAEIVEKWSEGGPKTQEKSIRKTKEKHENGENQNSSQTLRIAANPHGRPKQN